MNGRIVIENGVQQNEYTIFSKLITKIRMDTWL